jgi:hypothetical protein
MPFGHGAKKYQTKKAKKKKAKSAYRENMIIAGGFKTG